MKDKIQILKIAADRLKSDPNFWSSKLQEFDREKMQIGELEFYKLCLCKIPKDEEGLKKIAKYCNVDYKKIKEKLKSDKTKYVFKWYITDGYTYGYDIIIPFECDDLTKFIYEAIEKIEASEYGAEILGCYIKKNETDIIEESFFKLEDWFEQNKFDKK